MASGRLGRWATDWVELGLDAAREIRAHKMRSLLTLFGVVFGAASVVSMTSLAAAVQRMATDEIIRVGMPRTVAFYDRGPRSDATRAADIRHTGIRLSDITGRGNDVRSQLHGTPVGEHPTGPAHGAGGRHRRRIPALP
jgi:hypothetical protein